MSLNLPEFLWRWLCKYQHASAALSLINCSDSEHFAFRELVMVTASHQRWDLQSCSEREEEESEGTLLSLYNQTKYISKSSFYSSLEIQKACKVYLWLLNEMTHGTWAGGWCCTSARIFMMEWVRWKQLNIGTQWENSRILLMIIYCCELNINLS